MSGPTEYYPLNSELDLIVKDTQSPLTVPAISLALTQPDDQLIEYRLTFCANPELYQRIDFEALFNLIPDMRTPISAVEFLPESDIVIEVTLNPDRLPLLGG